MNKTKFKYVKYTKQELDRYVRDKNSCITLTNSEIHIGFPPWGFANFQTTLTNIISRDKIGKYDAKLDGIVLEVRNIKVFGTAYAVHDDDPYNHINIKANFYVFQPRIGAIIKGLVKHISHGHVAVIIYRVFNVSIRFNRSTVQDSLKINQQISFRIKKFELQGAMPYIEGELIENHATIKPKSATKHLKFEDDEDNESSNNGGDSGISTEETNVSKRTTSNLKTEMDSSSENSSSESDSDSEPDETSTKGLFNQLFPGVKIKEEKLSDAEETSDSSSESDDEMDDVKTKVKQEKNAFNSIGSISIANVKQEKISPECSSSSESSEDDDSNEPQIPLHKIKKETKAEQRTSSTTFIPRPIKSEPQSDVEGHFNFKTPTVKSQKRKRESSISGHIDSLVDDLLNTPNSKKSKKSKAVDDMHQSLGDLSMFQSPGLSSTLKIKQEPQSEDESAKRKKSKKSLDNSKSLKSIESDLFDSFLK